MTTSVISTRTTVVLTLLALIRFHLLITPNSHAAVMQDMRLLLLVMSVSVTMLMSALPEYTPVVQTHHATTPKEAILALVMMASVVMALHAMTSMSVTVQQTAVSMLPVATLSVVTNASAQMVTSRTL